MDTYTKPYTNTIIDERFRTFTDIVKKISDLPNVKIHRLDFIKQMLWVSVKAQNPGIEGLLESAKFLEMTHLLKVEQIDVDSEQIIAQWVDGLIGLSNEEIAMLRNNKKIMAIKLYRERNKVGLADAKNAVEKAEAQLGLVGERRYGL